MKNEHLRNARNERGFTQRQLANKVGVALVTLRKWEGGTRSPSSESRDRLCQILGKTEAELGIADLPQEATLASPALQERPAQGDENRQRMMRRVDTLWISGVLDHSLPQGTLIHLYVREQPDAILNPWAQSVQESNLPPQPLPASTHITQVYDDTDGAFLLLGEPGAGKTTLLLELTRDLLDRAEQDAYHPIPVVFNLSSWAQKRHVWHHWFHQYLCSPIWRNQSDRAHKRGHYRLLLWTPLRCRKQNHESAAVTPRIIFRKTLPFLTCDQKSDIHTVQMLPVRIQMVLLSQPSLCYSSFYEGGITGYMYSSPYIVMPLVEVGRTTIFVEDLDGLSFIKARGQ